MRAFLLSLAVFGAVASDAGEPRVPVIVELFTSEGCSSCPAADTLLLSLVRTQPVAGVEVIPLGLHVTYWDHIGWADPFGDPAFTDRQQRYAGALGGGTYTPQLVVDGVVGFAGGPERALAAVSAAGSTPKTPVSVRVVRITQDAVEVEVALRDVPRVAGDLVVALTQRGARSEVKRGENTGKVLSHVAVVRALRVVPTAPKATVRLPRQPAWSPEVLDVVAFVQAQGQKRVLGAATVPVAGP